MNRAKSLDQCRNMIQRREVGWKEKITAEAIDVILESF
jgi:hypothetical protein